MRSVSSLAEARAVMERSGSGLVRVPPAWRSMPTRWCSRSMRTTGSSAGRPIGFRLAGVLDHGTDHRSQVCTALTALGTTPPKIDVFDYGLETGRIVEQMPGA